VPTLPADTSEYREIDVLLSPTSHLATAVEQISPNRKDRQVVVLDDPKVNQRPSDREELINPNLFGFSLRRVIAPPRPAR
jgi:hypothetical protein